jgi:hypothetical protein
MPTWKSKICRGMDVVEQITFTRQDIDSEENIVRVSATYVPGADEEKPREEWTQAEIDAIGERLVAGLDAELARIIEEQGAA